MRKTLLIISMALMLTAAVFGANNIVISYAAGGLSFDPFHTYTATEAQIYTGVFEGLVSYNPLTLEPLPAVAESWEISPDGKTYRFRLRENARFFDGTRVTAEHFINTWIALLHPAEEAEYSFLFDIIEGAHAYRTASQNDKSKVGMKAIGDGIVEIKLNQPAAHFIKILAHHTFVALHPNHLEWRGTDSAARRAPTAGYLPTGNGAFYIAEYSPERLILLKNPNYWDADEVKIPGVTVLFDNDTQGITDAFNKGEIHWAAGGIFYDALADENDLVVNPLFATSYFFFRSSESPWNIPDVRRALGLLIPWEQVRSEEFHFIPTDVLVPRVPDYPEVVGIRSTDKPQALELLEKTGFPNGKGLPNPVIKIPESRESRRVAELIRDAWKDALGITARIQEYNYSRYYGELQRDGYALGTITWIGDFPDPLTFLQMWTTDSNLNDAGYSDDKFDTLIDDSMRRSGVDRYGLLGKAEEILLGTAVVMPMSHSPAFNAVDFDKVQGWFPNALDIHPLKYLRFAVPRPLPGVEFADASAFTL